MTAPVTTDADYAADVQWCAQGPSGTRYDFRLVLDQSAHPDTAKLRLTYAQPDDALDAWWLGAYADAVLGEVLA